MKKSKAKRSTGKKLSSSQIRMLMNQPPVAATGQMSPTPTDIGGNPTLGKDFQARGLSALQRMLLKQYGY